MDRLKDTLTRISAQMRVLTVSQRLVVALCTALVVVSVLWLLKWSAVPQRVAVLEQDFDYARLSSAEAALRANDISFETIGQRVYVRAEDQDNAIRVLHESDAVPQDGRIDLDALIKDTNPFLPESERVFARTVAKGNKLAQIIRSNPLVADAEVVLNPEQKRRLGAPPDVPTASVIVTLKPGSEMTPAMVQGFASLVSGAVSGLKAPNVSIVDGRTFRHYAVPSPEDAVAQGLLDEMKRHEAHLLAKVVETLKYIPNVLASVTVDLDNTTQTTETQRFDKPEVSKEESFEESSSRAESPAEEGVYANVGTGISGGSGGGTSSTERRSTDFADAKLAEKKSVVQFAPGRKRVTASVKVPRSWIVSVFKVGKPEVEKPTEKDLEPVAAQERARIQASVAKTLMTDAKDVEVDVYPDTDAQGVALNAALGAALPSSSSAGATGSDAWGAVGTYGPQAGLGLTALIALFIMARIAKKSAALAAQGSETSRRGGDGLDALVAEETAEVLGTAEFSEEALEGKEVSPETLKSRNLVAQVSKLVEKDPHGSAELLRRWVQEQT
ncbi:MAG: hypothetical protein HS102_10900 [Planctomycetia bacterium]|nr:MAG: hypothetical protein EDS66_02555 [Planctomycetota bacterium]KAB2949090.1 MAG: hypothetical protein F9K17_04415 [Phycisphaerae bacterium]MBE7457123.1 hypothetical protein [Planctomycetia bacterium]MCK6463518.1 hypothetical protein [Phycisphaerae bacterium]MCQ3920505.1 hypothetical protein [Planctomycetota bacterium]